MRKLLALAVLPAILLAACGDDGSDTSFAPVTEAPVAAEPAQGEDSDSGSDSGPQDEGPVATSTLPSVDMVSVETGEAVEFSTLAPSELPILAWFWAPHCPSCNAEAKDVEAFAAANEDKVRVVGLGTQDDIALAEDFISRHDIESIEMLWEPGFDSWNHFQVTSQPTAILLDTSGSPVIGWRGQFDEQKVLETAATL